MTVIFQVARRLSPSLNQKPRAIAAVTLHCFTLTTVAPSLAWAAEHEEPASAAAAGTERAVAAISAKDVAVSPQRANVTLDPERTDVGAAPKERIDKDQLRAGTSTAPEKTEAPAAEVRGDEQIAQALPTGGDKSGVTSQAISTPKGEGKIQGMGESFSAQLSTGVATFSVPFSLPAARGGAQPSLGLEYSSASGLGLAGMGWSVGVPYIARQTDRGLPQYDDRAQWHANQDRFVFNGGQELVPICTVAADRSCAGALADEQMPSWAAGYQYFRPHVEGSFLRFFWSPDHRSWRVQDKGGITMELGAPLDDRTDSSRLDTAPNDSTHIFRWHLARSYDAYCAGSANCDTMAAPKPLNVVIYKYFQDGGQAYLSDIYDTTPAKPVANAWDTSNLERLAHHTRLRYEQRPDPTETYHSGWLIRQTQRLVGVDVTGKPAAGPGEARRQVRRYHLSYDPSFHTSYLASVQLEGRCVASETSASVPLESNGVLGASSCERLPAMTFQYSHTEGYGTSGARNASRLPGYEEIDARTKQIGGSPPHAIDEELSDFFDINADGLPDVLVTAPGTYGNDYGVFFNSAGGVRDTFGAVSQMGVSGVLGANSSSIKLSNANVAPLDADGDGVVDLLHMPKVKTYSVYRPVLRAGNWVLDGEAITSANQLSPQIDLGKDASETRVMDVNSDGLVDVVQSTGTAFKTFFALGRLPNGHLQFGHGAWRGSDSADISNDPVSTCVPYSGSPVRFSDADIKLADLNGDGIQDIVRVRRGDFRYWPGRGNGFWGTGALDDCPAGTFGDKRFVTMDTAPMYADIDGTSLRLDDVNGDGLDDLVQVRFDAVDVYLNVDGHGWTERFIIGQTPSSSSFANRVRLVDINGSGTRDVAWGDGKKYQYMDLAGGRQPGLLVRVENGLGKSTDIEYSTSAEEMLAAERTGVACRGDTGPFESAWCNKTPVVTHVVKRVTESDNLAIAGVPASQYVTEYGYRDPLYEGRQREFRGFRRARTKRVGDDNSPTDFSESAFLLGECEDETPSNGIDECALSERWRDNPREALKGLPVVTESYDALGNHLSTQSITYRLRQLYSGLDGRSVRHAFSARQRTTTYDTSGPTNGDALVAQTAATQAAGVQLELKAPANIASAAFSGLACSSATLPADPSDGVKLAPVPLRALHNYASVETFTYVDALGNQFATLDKGCIAGEACPTKQTGNAVDEALCSFSRTTRVASWTYRADLSWTSGSVDTVNRKKTLTKLDAFGAPLGSKATLKGSVPLLRFHAVSGRAVAPAPSTASVNSPSDDPSIDLVSKTYDAFGNVLKQTGPNGRCSTVTYDVDSYSMLPMSENIYTGTCETGTPLTTVASYNRSFGVVTSVEDMTRQTTRVKHDGFGRVLELRRPRPDATAISDNDLPAVRISYDLPPAGSGRAYSVIHTETQDGASVKDAQYLESYAYVDGMGRTRVGLSEADTTADHGNKWIVSSIAEFDAKGAVRRQYLPFYLAANPVGFPVANAQPNAQYGRQRYDAFGRQTQTLDTDGTVTLQTRYHALTTDLFDAADIYSGPHAGTYASTRNDGHGRTVATTERIHVNGAIEAREVRTQYLSTGEPAVITRVRVDKEATSPPVARWMLYDSLGRMVVNADPHATVSFKADPATYTSALKTWRYAYNDAGDLVGTSDARGCGQNFFYDNAGRPIAEDYSPCTAGHALYSAPDLTTTDGIEVLYQYDAAPPNVPRLVGLPPSYGSGLGQFSPSSALLLGRLVAVHDRGATTWLKYDGRGRVIQTNRKIGVNVMSSTVIGTRYRPRWYTQDASFDAADRPVTKTSGATQLLGNNGLSAVTTSYTRRGTLGKVSSSYGDLITKIDRDAEGKVIEVVYGDKAKTTTHSDFDSRRRLRSVQTYRGTPALWSQSPAAYSPAPAPDPALPSTFQLQLEDVDYTYDVVGNPTEIRDWRDPRDWPSGSKPVSRRMEYDDLNRLTRVDYQYPGSWDTAVSPFAPELGGFGDNRRPGLVGFKLLPERPAWQTYAFDWLGNTTKTDDDAHAFYDRSLGTVTQGTASKPYQVTAAAHAASTGPHSGSIASVTYDEAGDLLTMKVNRTATDCDVPGGCTANVFNYQWDEVGRLQQASHTAGSTVFTFQYVYDAHDERVIREDATTANRKQTLYVFDSLELRGTSLQGDATQEYVLGPDVEVAYLNANGVRVGRLVKEPDSAAAGFKGEPQLALASGLSPSLHVFLELPNHMGSTSLVVDLATSELVEARTYQPFGATESDYRPDRWKGFREDYGFTGKEEDVEVGLQYFGKRFLSPYLGRWISADPLAVHSPGSADLNVYAYVKGSVLQAVDPNGLSPWTLEALWHRLFDSNEPEVYVPPDQPPPTTAEMAHHQEVVKMVSGPKVEMAGFAPKQTVMRRPSGTEQIGPEAHASWGLGHLQAGGMINPNFAYNEDEGRGALNVAWAFNAGLSTTYTERFQLKPPSFGAGIQAEHTYTRSIDDIAGSEQSKDLSGQLSYFDAGISNIRGIDTNTGKLTYEGESARLSLSTPSFSGGWGGSQVTSWNVFTFRLRPPALEVLAPPRPDDTPAEVEVPYDEDE